MAIATTPTDNALTDSNNPDVEVKNSSKDTNENRKKNAKPLSSLRASPVGEGLSVN